MDNQVVICISCDHSGSLIAALHQDREGRLYLACPQCGCQVLGTIVGHEELKAVYAARGGAPRNSKDE